MFFVPIPFFIPFMFFAPQITFNFPFSGDVTQEFLNDEEECDM